MKRVLSLLTAMAITAISLTSQSLAQDGPDATFAKGVAMLQNKQFADAQGVFDGMITQYGKDPLKDFGPRFGAIYYHRALAFLGQEKFPEAASDFEAAASQFPNKQGETRVNPYQTISFLQAGFAHMQAKDPDYAKALEFFQRFKKEMDTRPYVLDRDNVVYNRAALWANTAICEAKTDKPRNAAETFALIIKDEGGNDRENRATFEKTTQLIHGAAVEIIDAFLQSKNPEEGKIFVDEHARILREDPGIVYFYVPRYLQMASEAAKNEQYGFALSLYSILPNSREVAAGLEANLHKREAAPSPNGQPTAYGKLLEQIKEKLAKDIADGTPLEVYALDGVARIYQINSNYQAVYGVYRTLAKQYPKSSLRPQILYFAALAASVTNRLDETQNYGEAFIKEFPNHEDRPKVEELMVEGMFWAGRYEDSLRIAERVRPNMAEGSKGAELCDFVIGGSYYFLGRYAEAEPVLKAHVEKYKDSTHREMARFYQADNLARLNRFTEAGTLLDEFLNDYPESSVLDMALYARANAHYNLDQTDSAVARLSQFVAKRPYSQIRDQAQNLFGNVFESQQKPEEAEQAYKKAKETAEQLGNTRVAAESLVYLMGLLANDEKRASDVAAFYDEFFQKYAEDDNRTKAAVIPLKALEKLNRLPEALKRLEEIIAGFGNNIEGVGLEDCIVAYANYAEKGGMNLQQLRDRLYNFPNLPPDADITRARLRMALIDVYEKKIKDEEDEAAKNRLRGEIDGLFAQLKKDFALDKLPNYTLNRIGDFLMKAGKSEQAREYFEQVRKSNQPQFKDKAMFNLAVILAESDKAGDRDEAIKLLDQLVADYPTDRGLAERITRQKAITYELSEKWEDASKMWLEYLKNPNWVKHQTEAYYFLALSQEKRKLWGDALTNHLKVFSIDPGNMVYSPPSWFRFCEIQYKELGKKQEGYEQLYNMVQKIAHLEPNEAKFLKEEAPTMLDATTKRRLGNRLSTNFIQKAIATKAEWEGAGGINVITPEPDKKKNR